MLSLKSTHQATDLMKLIAQEIPIDVHSTAQDATKQMQKVLRSVYDIDNLNTSAFLTVSGKQAQLKLDKIAERSEGLSFFRISYSLDPSTIDPMILQKPTFLSLCLHLPQHRYFKNEDRIE